jgi:hypothetical protein
MPLVILAAEEHCKDPYLARPLIHNEIEDRALFCDRSKPWKELRPQRALMWLFAQRQHRRLDASEAYGGALNGAVLVFAKLDIALDQKIEDGGEVAVRGAGAQDLIL